MNKSVPYHIVVLLVFLFVAQFVSAQSSQGDITLPGHFLGENEALTKSTDVAVVTFLNRGKMSDGPPDIIEYDDAYVQVVKSLKGKTQDKLNCSFNRFYFPESKAEAEPAVGSRYIVFMRYRGEYRGESLYFIFRFSAFNDKHLAEIEKIITPPQ